jgi:hypothetical protein
MKASDNKAPQAGEAASKADAMLDAFFAGERACLSLRECYVALTGDRDVTGEFARCDPARMREGFGEDFLEALTTAAWPVALGAAVERRVHAAMADMVELQAWRKIAKVVPVKTFQAQKGVRIGGYGNLPSVAEGDPYAALTSPSEEAASYAVAKRGGVESITLEMLANDDAAAVKRVPAELALAAAMTLYEFVFDFIRTNPTIYDAVALFHASHGNLGSSALDATSFFAASMAIAKQARFGSGKRVGFGRKTLLVPLDLQQTAYTNFVQGQTDASIASGLVPEVVVVPYWTDANDWAVVNDPAYCPTIEMGFLNGRELPEVLVDDEPNMDSFFSNDKITYKIRHVYGGVPVEYRGMFKSVL